MCAIFGVLDYQGKLTSAQRLRMVKELGTAAEVRGTDATGIAYFQRERLCIQKAPKAAHDVADLGGEAITHLMSRFRCFLDAQPLPLEVGYPRCISSPNLGGSPQLLDHAEPLGRCQLPPIVQYSENRTHGLHLLRSLYRLIDIQTAFL